MRYMSELFVVLHLEKNKLYKLKKLSKRGHYLVKQKLIVLFGQLNKNKKLICFVEYLFVINPLLLETLFI